MRRVLLAGCVGAALFGVGLAIGLTREVGHMLDALGTDDERLYLPTPALTGPAVDWGMAPTVGTLTPIGDDHG